MAPSDKWRKSMAAPLIPAGIAPTGRTSLDLMKGGHTDEPKAESLIRITAFRAGDVISDTPDLTGGRNDPINNYRRSLKKRHTAKHKSTNAIIATRYFSKSFSKFPEGRRTTCASAGFMKQAAATRLIQPRRKRCSIESESKI